MGSLTDYSSEDRSKPKMELFSLLSILFFHTTFSYNFEHFTRRLGYQPSQVVQKNTRRRINNPRRKRPVYFDQDGYVRVPRQQDSYGSPITPTSPPPSSCPAECTCMCPIPTASTTDPASPQPTTTPTPSPSTSTTSSTESASFPYFYNFESSQPPPSQPAYISITSTAGPSSNSSPSTPSSTPSFYSYSMPGGGWSSYSIPNSGYGYASQSNKNGGP